MKNILIFNDISGLGNCSMCANLPILTKLGHYCIPVVTATFSCNTMFEHFTYQRNNSLTKCVADIFENRIADTIYVGFSVDVDILRQIYDVAKTFDGYLFVDPILGDNGKLYKIFDDNYVAAMKNLVKLADCISPNLTEACLLADVSYDDLMKHAGEPTFLALCGKTFQNFLQQTGAKSAVITGVDCGKALGNIVFLPDGRVRYVTNERVEVSYSGTGDAFSSVLLGEISNGCDVLRATEIAANFVGKAAEASQCKDMGFGVEFCRVIDDI